MPWIAVVLSLLSEAAPPAAGPPPVDQAREALVAAALEASPEVAEARARIAAAQARTSEATALPNPMLEVTYVNDGVSPSLGTREMTTLGVMLSQELTRPALRRARGAVAASEADAEMLRLRRAELGVTARVDRAWVELRRAHEALALTEAQEPLWTQVVEAARARYEVGRGAQTDLVHAQLERTRLGVARTDAEAAVTTAQAALDALLGRAWDGPLPDAPLVLTPMDRSVEELLAAIDTESPELRAAAVAEQREERAVELARRTDGFDLTAQAGYMNRGGLDPMWQVGLGVGLPVRRSAVRARVAAAEADLAATRSRRAALDRRLQQQVRQRAAAIHAARQKADLYGGAILPQAQLAVESALTGYGAGAAALSDALESMASLYRDRLTHLANVAEHERQVATLFEWNATSATDEGNDRSLAMTGGMQ